ncbi:MAG TPA: GH92 family glycosyl hydrolase, partial [Thermoanaerobaculia bacterium]|nr:GH92 family glycosyl hydrolase [Thermoanaerobaculia bacterium]
MSRRPSSLGPLALAALLVGMPHSLAGAAPPADLAAEVNPFVGTQDGGSDFGHGGGAGNDFPGAALPFGTIQWSPDTVRRSGGGYKYEDTALRGFSLTHISGPGCAGAQDFPLVPVAGEPLVSPATHPEAYAMPFSHQRETATPGSYAVTLDSGVAVELAVAQRSGIGRFTFPLGAPATLLFDVTGSVGGADDGWARVEGSSVSGWVRTGGFCGTGSRYTVYFQATFDRPFTRFGSWNGDSLAAGEGTSLTVQGPATGVYVQLDGTQPVVVRVAISYVTVAGAAANLRAEVAAKSFEQVRDEARAAWNGRLGQIRVTGGAPADRRTFYTALYHALLQPYVFDDVDGSYVGFDAQRHSVVRGHHHYATFSGWDVYRGEMQLIALLAPDVGSDIAQSMYEDAHAIGDVWDRWSHQNSITGVMNGDPYHSIVASLYAFGARDFDARGALAAMVRGADRVGADARSGYDERPGNADYLRLGYVPGDVSTTLEYNVADFGIAQLAARLGEQATAEAFLRRAQSWQRLYDPANGWLAPRFGDGSFLAPYDPGDPSWFVEGNGAQYHWMVPHNPLGLFAMMGGRARAAARLDEFFAELNAGSDRPHAYLGNEPSMLSPWLYVWAGEPAKTQDVVRRAQRLLFKPTADGLVGNDDLGAMSAWYVWASLGMYPAIPGRAELVLNSPLFEHIEVRRASGATLTISAPGASDANHYVRSLKVDGRPSQHAWLPESFALAGGTLDYVLGPTPDPSFGRSPADAPPSFASGQRPYVAAVDPGLAPLEPGGSRKAVLLAQSAGGSVRLRWSAKPPAGVSVSPASGSMAVGAGGLARQALSLRVAGDMPLGVYSVPITLARDPDGDSSTAAR